MPLYFTFDPLIKRDLFVKFSEMAERNPRKSSVLQMVAKPLLLADDSANHRVESTDQFMAGSWCLRQKKDFERGFLVRAGEGKGKGAGEAGKEHRFVLVLFHCKYISVFGVRESLGIADGRKEKQGPEERDTFCCACTHTCTDNHMIFHHPSL